MISLARTHLAFQNVVLRLIYPLPCAVSCQRCCTDTRRVGLSIASICLISAPILRFHRYSCHDLNSPYCSNLVHTFIYPITRPPISSRLSSLLTGFHLCLLPSASSVPPSRPHPTHPVLSFLPVPPPPPTTTTSSSSAHLPSPPANRFSSFHTQTS
jgi:hypothetical protein